MKDSKGHGSDPKGGAAAHQAGVEKAIMSVFDAGHHFASYMQHTGKDKLFRVDEGGKLHPPGVSPGAIRRLSRAGKIKASPDPQLRYGTRYTRA